MSDVGVAECTLIPFEERVKGKKSRKDAKRIGEIWSSLLWKSLAFQQARLIPQIGHRSCDSRRRENRVDTVSSLEKDRNAIVVDEQAGPVSERKILEFHKWSSALCRRS